MNPIIEELRKKTDCVTPSWAARAVDAMVRLEAERDAAIARAEAAEAWKKAAMEQEPVAYRIDCPDGLVELAWQPDGYDEDYMSGTGEKTLSFDGPSQKPNTRDEVVNPIWTPLYARPVPAAQTKFKDSELDEIHQLAYELGGTESGEYILDGEQLDQVVVKAASLFYKPAAPAVAVPAVRHYPEEFGPSDNRKLHCSCGNPDPSHMDKAVPAVPDDKTLVDLVYKHFDESDRKRLLRDVGPYEITEPRPSLRDFARALLQSAKDSGV